MAGEEARPRERLAVARGGHTCTLTRAHTRTGIELTICIHGTHMQHEYMPHFTLDILLSMVVLSCFDMFRQCISSLSYTNQTCNSLLCLRKVAWSEGKVIIFDATWLTTDQAADMHAHADR